MAALDEEAREAPFRLQGKQLLLTWPQCPMRKEAVMEIVKGKFAEENIICVCVCEEQHADGAPHLHACVILRTRCNIRGAHTLDLVDVDGTVYHGDYRAARSSINALEYVRKGGNYCTYGEAPDDAKSRKRQLTIDEVEQCTSEHQLYSYVCSNGLWREAPSLKALWKSSRSSKKAAGRFQSQSFREHQELSDALAGLHATDKSLLILGPTGVGKTQWLLNWMADRPFRRITDVDELRLVQEQDKWLLLDDVQLSRLHRGTLLHLLDARTDRSIRCRYSNAQLVSDQNLIICGNSLELVLGEHQNDDAILRRIQIIELGQERLFL